MCERESELETEGGEGVLGGERERERKEKEREGERAQSKRIHSIEHIE